MTSLLNHALLYVEKGLSVIPIKPDIDPKKNKAEKKPYIKWAEFQERKASAEEVTNWWTRWPNAMIGLVTGKICGLCVVDFDSYKPDFDAELVLEYFPDSIVTPTAVTANKGTHLYFKIPEDHLGIMGNTGKLPAVDLRANGNYIVAPPSIDGLKRQYQWINGLDLFKNDLTVLPSLYISFLNGGVLGGGMWSNTPPEPQTTTITTNNHTMFEDGRRDNDLFHTANCLVKGGMLQHGIFQVLERLIISWGENSDPKWINTKIKSALLRSELRERNLAAEVREWVMTTTGHFLTTDVHKDLNLTTKDPKKAANMALLRLIDEGVLEKYGERRGSYRRVEQDDDDLMGFIENPIYEYPVRLPFGLNTLCKLYPKNIIIVAGSKGAGKTAFLLNIVKMNETERDVVYLNSEMGDEEWTDRLKKMGYQGNKDIRFVARKRHTNFHDRITPDNKIFIIDYMEIHTNFYEIAKPIRQIHEKLEKGICFIAVQKKMGEMLGRGAEFSQEKSRLYLSLDYLRDQRCSKLTIVDAKNVKINESIRDWSRRIKIYDGSKMEAIDKNWVL
uniref:Putative bifunctional DNA primase/polymerase n=4 Tax=viral metagenome TaxID=1070528 RepID=A0A6M3K867_9ZZZZ